jgi:hypothetical protein
MLRLIDKARFELRVSSVTEAAIFNMYILVVYFRKSTVLLVSNLSKFGSDSTRLLRPASAMSQFCGLSDLVKVIGPQGCELNVLTAQSRPSLTRVPDQTISSDCDRS